MNIKEVDLDLTKDREDINLYKSRYYTQYPIEEDVKFLEEVKPDFVIEGIKE